MLSRSRRKEIKVSCVKRTRWISGLFHLSLIRSQSHRFDTLRERIADLEKENADLKSHAATIGSSAKSPISHLGMSLQPFETHGPTLASPPQNSPHRVLLPNVGFEASSLLIASPSNRPADLAAISQDLLEVANGKSASFVGHGASNLYKLENTAVSPL